MSRLRGPARSGRIGLLLLLGCGSSSSGIFDGAGVGAHPDGGAGPDMPASPVTMDAGAETGPADDAGANAPDSATVDDAGLGWWVTEGCLALNRCTTVRLRDDGRHVEHAQDDDCDGVMETCTRTAWDEWGQQTEWRLDDNCDGEEEVANCHYNEYDEAGRVLSSSWGCDEPINCLVNTWDEEGRLLRTVGDAFCDGESLVCSEHTWDDQGRETSFENDQGCDGLPELCRSAMVLEDGSWVIQLDRQCDGAPDLCSGSDAEGMETYSDDGCDGTPEACRERTYDDAGHVLTERYDGMCDGVWEPCIAYSYDDHGHETSRTIDRDCDGVPDRQCGVRTFDEDGHVLTEELDDDCDGQREWCARSWYDDEGVEVLRQEDVGCDGDPWVTYELITTPEGRREIHRGPDQCVTMLYNTLGDCMGKLVDEGCNGTNDVCEVTHTERN